MRRIGKGLAVSFIGAGAGLMLYCGSFYLKSWQENRQMRNRYESIRETCLDTEKDGRPEEKTKKDRAGRKREKGKEKDRGIFWNLLERTEKNEF